MSDLVSMPLMNASTLRPVISSTTARKLGLVRKVSQDLTQVTPPPRDTRAQSTLLAITQRGRGKLDDLAGNPDNARARRAVIVALQSTPLPSTTT